MPVAIDPDNLLWPSMSLRRLVASTARFQALVSAADENGALPFVHYPDASDEAVRSNPDDPESPLVLLHPRPRAIVSWRDQWQTSRIATATWNNQGTLLLTLEAIVPSQYRANRQDAADWWCNEVGVILHQLRENSGRDLPEGEGTYLSIQTLAMLTQPSLADPQDFNGQHVAGAEFAVEWRP